MHLLILSHISLIPKIIKVPRIRLGVELRHKRRLLLAEAVPIHLCKVRMSMDLLDAVEAAALASNEARDEVPRALRQEVRRILVHGLAQHLLPLLEILPGFVDGRACEGWISGERLEQHASQTPVVDGEIVLLALEHLWGHVVRTADDGLGVVDFALAEGTVVFAALSGGALFHRSTEGADHVANTLQLNTHRLDLGGGQESSCKAEVGQLDVAAAVDEEVLGLQVAMDVPKLVQCVDTGEHLGDVEAGMAIVEHTGVVEKGAEVSTGNVFL